MNSLLQHAIAHTTRTTYNSGVQAFLQLSTLYQCCNTTGSSLPASEETLMLFATYLTYCLKPQPIKVYLYAVRNFHIEHGLPNPLQDCIRLQRLMRGIKRTFASCPNHRPPAILRSFATHLDFQHYDHLMIWVAMLLAFFDFLRSSELTSLQVADITPRQSGFNCSIRSSKTDPFRRGAVVIIAPIVRTARSAQYWPYDTTWHAVCKYQDNCSISVQAWRSPRAPSTGW